MTFAQFNFDENIFKAISACGYENPTPIQVGSIPDIMLGRDLVASAPTGTGKTAAFVLPALHRLCLSKAGKKPRVLILTPTRELATQITEGASKYGKFLNLNIVSMMGGMPYRQQLRELSRPIDVIVATPGRLLDHMDNKRLDLSEIEMLILDEADRMLDMGFIDDVKEISKATPATRQTLLFSATVDDRLAKVIKQLLKDPKRVDFSHKTLAPALIKQEAYLADNTQHKNRLLQHFLDNESIYKAIIFSATKVNCDQLTNELCNKGYEAAAIHGDLRQQVRNRTLEQFKRGKIQFLIATDVAARGIDVNDITHVINYDLPKFSEDYVHRIGRTGRAGRDGIAISLVLPTDARHLQKIERYTGKKLELSVVAGLEPTKRLAKNAPASGGGKRFGNGDSDGYRGKKSAPRGSYARSADAPRGEFNGGASRYSDSKPRKAFGEGFKRGGDDRPRKAFGEGFKRDEDRPRKAFGEGFKRGGDDRPRKAFGEGFKRSEDRPRKAFGEGFKRDEDRPRKAFGEGFKRNDDRPRKAFGEGFKRDEDRPRKAFGEGFKRNDDRPRKTFGEGFKRSEDKPRKSFNDGFKRGDDSKPRKAFGEGFKRGDDNKPRKAFGEGFKRGDDKPRKSFNDGFKRSEDKPRTYARAKSEGGATPRSTDPRVSYGKSTGGRNERGRPAARSGASRPGAAKTRRFAKQDN
jgi:superfamily II DNA/RNA helicase